jgi:hypothetical protein
MDYEDVFGGLMMFLFIALLFLAVLTGVKNVSNSNFCLSKGYPDSRITITFEKYCIKRVDQTDTVIKADDLK